METTSDLIIKNKAKVSASQGLRLFTRQKSYMIGFSNVSTNPILLIYHPLKKERGYRRDICEGEGDVRVNAGGVEARRKRQREKRVWGKGGREKV